MHHPMVNLQLSVDCRDYHSFSARCPNVRPVSVKATADSGAQSCLWSLDDYVRAGFKETDLIPVGLDLSAANQSQIPIVGAILAHLHGESKNGVGFSCATMIYISPAAKGLYLSQEAMMDLGIVSRDFPSVGTAIDSRVSAMPNLTTDHYASARPSPAQ